MIQIIMIVSVDHATAMMHVVHADMNASIVYECVIVNIVYGS